MVSTYIPAETRAQVADGLDKVTQTVKRRLNRTETAASARTVATESGSGSGGDGDGGGNSGLNNSGLSASLRCKTTAAEAAALTHEPLSVKRLAAEWHLMRFQCACT
jgi:hypothetical protein